MNKWLIFIILSICVIICFFPYEPNNIIYGCTTTNCKSRRCIGPGCINTACTAGGCKAGDCMGTGCKAGDCIGSGCRGGNCYGDNCIPGGCIDTNCPIELCPEQNKICFPGKQKQIPGYYKIITSFFPKGTLFNPIL